MRRRADITSLISTEGLHHHWGILNDAKRRAASLETGVDNRDREILVSRYKTPLWETPASKLGYQSVLFKLPSNLSNIISELETFTKGETTKLLLEDQGRLFVNILFDPMAMNESGVGLTLMYSMYCLWDEGFGERVLTLQSLGLSGIV